MQFIKSAFEGEDNGEQLDFEVNSCQEPYFISRSLTFSIPTVSVLNSVFMEQFITNPCQSHFRWQRLLTLCLKNTEKISFQTSIQRYHKLNPNLFQNTTWFCHMWHTAYSILSLSKICQWWHQTYFALSGCSFEVLQNQEKGEIKYMLSGVSHPVFLDMKGLWFLCSFEQVEFRGEEKLIKESFWVISEVHQRGEKKHSRKNQTARELQWKCFVLLAKKTRAGQNLTTHFVQTFLVTQQESPVHQFNQSSLQFGCLSWTSLWFILSP